MRYTTAWETACETCMILGVTLFVGILAAGAAITLTVKFAQALGVN